MEIIDIFFKDIQELYEFERGFKIEKYLTLKEKELPALELKIEANRGIHNKIKNEIIMAGIKTLYINTYLADFNDALFQIEELIDVRLKDELINSYGDRTFEIVSRFKSLAWTMRIEITNTIFFLKLVLDPKAPEKNRNELIERLIQKNIESNTPPLETRGFKSNLNTEKLKLLFNWLVVNNYLDPNSDEEFFTQVFSEGKININSKNKLNWIDVPKRNRKSINTQTILKLLESIGLEFTEEEFVPDIQKKIALIFINDFGNLKSKHSDYLKKGGKQLRQELISDYISTLLKP